MKRLFILIAALILAVNSAYALPRSVALRNSGNQAGYERLVRGLEPTLWLATDEGITVSGSNVTQWDSKIGSISFTQGTAANQPLLSTSGVENLVLQSQTFDSSSWTKFRSSISSDSTTAPDGTTTADTLVEDATASNTHYMRQGTQTFVSGETYRVSVNFKDASRRYVGIYLSTTAFSGNPQVWVDLNDGTVVAESATSSYGVIDKGSGWYEVWMIATADATASDTFAIYLSEDDSPTLSYNGDGSSGVYVWGSQIRRVSTPPTYVATTNAPVHGSTTGRKGVVFDGVDQYMDTVSATLETIVDADTAEIFVVVAGNDPASASDSVFGDSSGNLRVRAVSGYWRAENYDTGYDVAASTLAFTSGQPLVLNARHDSGSVYLIDRTSETSAVTNDTAYMANKVRVGQATASLDGAIYEIITFDKVLSDNQRQAIIEGLESKYRID